MRRPLELRTTLTGFPARQFLDSAPSLSFRGASQFKARALQVWGSRRGSTLERCSLRKQTPVIPVHVCQRLVEAVLSDSLVSREVAPPAASVCELIPPILQRRSHGQPTLHHVCSNSIPTNPVNGTGDPPLRPQSPQPAPVNKSRRCSARGSHQHEACERLLRSPDGTDLLIKHMISCFLEKK